LLSLAQNAPENAWRPGSARTRWGSLSAPPDPLAAVKGLGPREAERERGGEGKKGGGGEGERREREGGRGRENGWEGTEREGRQEGTRRGPQFYENDPPSRDGWLRACLIMFLKVLRHL